MVAMENFEIKYSDRIGKSPVSNTGPIRLRDDSSESAIRMPTTPPAENAPPHGRQKGRMESAVETLRNSTAAPKTFHPAAGMASDRIHLQASIHNSTGILKALRPSNWKQRSAVYDPAKPMRLCACTAPVTEFQEGSWGWYEIRQKMTN